MASIWIKIPKNKPYTDNAVAPPQVYEGGELYEFDDQVPAELSAAQRILAARAGYDISNLVNQTNPLLISDGSVAAPAIAPGSDADTGIFFPAVGEMAVALAGALALTFSAAAATFETAVVAKGDVSIHSADSADMRFRPGTNAYRSSLTFENATGVEQFSILNVPNNNYLAFRYAGVDGFVLGNDGDVGIGTVDPLAKLHVQGPSNGELLRLASTVPDRGLTITQYAIGGVNQTGYEFNARGAAGTAELTFKIASALAFTLDSNLTATFEGDVVIGMNQKLGVGTTPDQTLHLHSTGNTYAKISTSYAGPATARFLFDLENDPDGTAGFTFQNGGVTAGSLTFQYNPSSSAQYLGLATGSGNFRVYTNGRASLGKSTAPAAELDVVGSATFEKSTPVLTLRTIGNTGSTTGRIYFGNTIDGDLRGALFYYHDDDRLDVWTGGAVALSVASNNDVTFEGGIGIGAAPSANHSLHVQRGDSNVIAKFERTGANESSAWFTSAGNNMYLTLKGLGTGKEVEILGMSTGDLQLHTAGTLSATFDTNQNMILEGDLTGKGKIINTPVELTISAGAVTATCSAHAIGGEGNAADTLTTINGGVDGMILVLTGTGTGSEAITVTSAGNLNLNGGGSRTLTDAADTLTLQYRTAAGGWIELAYSNNGGLS